MLTHQPLDLTARSLLTGPSERLPRPAVAVGLIVGQMRFADPAEQTFILLPAG